MYIEQTNSTNSLIKEQYTDCGNMFFVRTGFQTAGRGQSGNGWESERGRNILVSILLKDIRIEPARQFGLSVAVSLGVRDMLSEQLAAAGQDTDRLTIKWPNDIYWDDSKICGILIETALSGDRIDYAIAGIGININQTVWTGNAPNPVSLKMVTGRDYDIEELNGKLLKHIAVRTRETGESGQKTEYMNSMYRRDGWYWYKRREVNTIPTMPAKRSELNMYKADGTAFEGKISGITEQGEIEMTGSEGKRETFHFKEIQYII